MSEPVRLGEILPQVMAVIEKRKQRNCEPACSEQAQRTTPATLPNNNTEAEKVLLKA